MTELTTGGTDFSRDIYSREPYLKSGNTANKQNQTWSRLPHPATQPHTKESFGDHKGIVTVGCVQAGNPQRMRCKVETRTQNYSVDGK